MTGLKKDQRKRLYEALLDAFPDWAGLQRMVSFGLNERLETIAGGSGPLANSVFNLIQWAEAAGRVSDLLDAALQANPQSPVLQRAFGEIRQGRLTQPPAPRPLEAPAGYANRILDFRKEYIGSADRPVPFGGRGADMTALDDWLVDKAAPPYVLLTAPAGRGKSALLVHWTGRLAGRLDVAVVFFPVSVRFRTNLAGVVFGTLASQLAALHGDSPPAGDPPAERLREITREYLRRPLVDGRRLLVVLDGLDEAADWEVGVDLFPRPTLPHLRIVAAARSRAGYAGPSYWLRRLGWDARSTVEAPVAWTPPLNPLGRNDVADVLRRMGFPLDELGKRVDIVTRLHHVSGGDPLLVRLYVDDLWARGAEAARLRPEDLERIRPGFEGYFEKWRQDQQDLWGRDAPLRLRHVQTLFDLLAGALGPLSGEDVFALADAAGQPLSTHDLNDAVEAIARFIIGDGREQGYVFGHPKLGEFFWDELDHRERQRWEECFLQLGQRTVDSLAAGRTPELASRYAVQYYGAHLDRAGRGPEDLLALTTDGWRRAWEALEGAYSGFLNDVLRAWRTVRAADTAAVRANRSARWLGVDVRCALIQASITSISRNVPPELLAELVASGRWGPAEGLANARQKTVAGERAESLALLAPHLTGDRRERVCTEALDAVWRVPAGDSAQSVRVFKSLAPYMTSAQVQEALDVVRSASRPGIETPGWLGAWDVRTEVLAALSHGPCPSPLGLLREAMKARRPQRGRATVRTPSGTRDTEMRWLPTGVLVDAAHRLALSVTMRRQWLQQALFTARSDPTRQAEVLAMWAELMPHPPTRRMFRSVWERVLQRGKTERAAIDRLLTLRALAAYLPLPLVVETIERTAGHPPLDRAEALATLAEGVDEPPREWLVATALTAARAGSSTARVEERRRWAAVLTTVARLVREPERSEILIEAEAGARQVRDGPDRGCVVNAWVKELPRPAWTSAVAVGDSISDPESRFQTFILLARNAPAGETVPMTTKALAAAEKMIRSPPDPESLLYLVRQLPDSMLDRALELVLSVAATLNFRPVVEAMAGRLPASVLEGVFRQLVVDFEPGLKASIMLEMWLPHIRPEAVADSFVGLFTRAVPDGPFADSFASELLAKLAWRLPETDDRVGIAWKQALAWPYGRAQTRAVEILAPRMPIGSVDADLGKLINATDEYERARMLAAVAPRISPSRIGDVLPSILALLPNSGRFAFAAIAERLESQTLLSAWSTVTRSRPPDYVAPALATLAEFVPLSLLISEVLDWAIGMADTAYRSMVLEIIARRLPPSYPDAWSRLIDEFDRRSLPATDQPQWLSDDIIPNLPEPLLYRAMAWVGEIPAAQRIPYLKLLHRRLTARLLTDAVERVKALQGFVGAESFCSLLSTLLPHLDPPDRAGMLVTLALSVRHLPLATGSSCLADALSNMPDDEITPTLESIRGTIGPAVFAVTFLDAKIHLAPRQAAKMLASWLRDIDSSSRREALLNLVAHGGLASLPLPDWPTVIPTVTHPTPETDSYNATGAGNNEDAGSKLPHPVAILEELIQKEASDEIVSDLIHVFETYNLQLRFELVARLCYLRHLPPLLFERVVEMVRPFPEVASFGRTLAAIVRHLPEMERAAVVEVTLPIAMKQIKEAGAAMGLAYLLSLSPQPARLVARGVRDNLLTADSAVDALESICRAGVPLSAAERQAAYELWVIWIESATQMDRPQLLKRLAGVAEMLRYLGDTESINDALEALRDVGLWWP